MTLTVAIRTVTPDEIRNADVGDWRHLSPPDDMHQVFSVFVRPLGDWRHEFLVAIHELVECALCRHRGITDATVTAFDAEATANGIAEPGNLPDAPYAYEHACATTIEMLMANHLGIRWAEYDKAIDVALRPQWKREGAK